jgi:tRNA nucleotidyltransferase (CCA-adding enzyme)
LTGISTRELPAPREVRRIAERLAGAGFETWAVGGAVRDALAGLPPGDWDLTTAARPADVKRLFKRTVPIGIEHGTMGVLGKDGHLYEVTTFRRDVETFGRKARVVFADRLEEDLDRRDFTINAVAWSPLTGEVRDPHGGASDLAERVLRTVGDAGERFREDRLRVLRALRFAGRFDLTIEPGAWSAVRASADQLGSLSAERVREELFKVLALPRPSVSLRLYERSGVLAALYPELQACVGVTYGDGTVWDHLMEVVDAARPHRISVRMAALLHDAGRARPDGREHAAAGAAIAREVMTRLKASNPDRDRVSHLVAQHADAPSPRSHDPELRRWIRRVGLEYLRDLFRLLVADARARRADPTELVRFWRRTRRALRMRPPLDTTELAIGGAELRSLGLPAGPLYGEILRDLLEKVTDDPSLNRRDKLIRIVQAELDADVTD